MKPEELHYELLQQLTDEPAASQRGLAQRLGVSVGKLNYCLRELVNKGWVKVNSFRRSDNKWPREFLSRKEWEFKSAAT